MNSSVYVFGNLSSGYTQYPDEDFSSAIFSTFHKRSKATTQLAIHRDGHLMYYGYIRRLEQNQYIGLCVLLNDLMITSPSSLFSLFETAISSLAEKGHLIMFNESGNLVANAEKLFRQPEEVELVSESLKRAFDNLSNSAQKLPPENYSVGKDSVKEFSIEDDAEDILRSTHTHGYTFIYKSKGYNTAQMSSYKGVLTKMRNERDELKAKNAQLSRELAQAKRRERNMTWVSILGAIVLVLGVVLWNKVLFPSEVTHYETGEFVYYGPMKNKKPHGTGVAIYPPNDADGRKYYIGNFVNGERQDSTAILFYQDGDYYYGSMAGDKWEEGILYMNSDNSHFKGTFRENEPYDGAWFDHKEAYILKYGLRTKK